MSMTKEKLLNIMINTFVSCMNPGYPISIKNIAELENETYYQVRKYMKELEKEGLVQKEKFYYPGDYNYEYGVYESEGYLISGWIITDKCRKSEKYKEASKKEDELIEKCFNMKEEEYDKQS